MTTLEQGRQELHGLLQKAIILELSTIPPYMSALISLKPDSNRVPANIIRSVMMEEMLHMSLAGNLLSSIGGKIEFSADNVPTYPLTLEFTEGKAFKYREFDVDLAAMTSDNITTFTRIELPEGWDPIEPSLKATSEVEVPGYTIGDFYQMIEDKLALLCTLFGESAVFIGDPTKQIDVNYYWAGGGYPITINNLDSAKEAIQQIVEQGEGTPSSVLDGDNQSFGQEKDVAHFFRFREILYSRHYQDDDDPRLPPTGEAFEVNYQAVYPIKTNAQASDYLGDPVLQELNTEFNRQYSMMLIQIAEAINGNPQVLYNAILNGMHGMADVARAMVQTPITGNDQGLHGAPSFEWINVLPTDQNNGASS